MNKETFTCDCGFVWDYGRDGSHDCRPRYIARIKELEGAIAAHNKECDFLCDNDKHCDHRPRQCASCPKDWKIMI